MDVWYSYASVIYQSVITAGVALQVVSRSAPGEWWQGPNNERWQIQDLLERLTAVLRKHKEPIAYAIQFASKDKSPWVDMPTVLALMCRFLRDLAAQQRLPQGPQCASRGLSAVLRDICQNGDGVLLIGMSELDAFDARCKALDEGTRNKEKADSILCKALDENTCNEKHGDSISTLDSTAATTLGSEEKNEVSPFILITCCLV